MSRVLKRSWLATLVCLAFLISTVVPALAAPVGPSSQDEAIEFLKELKIVQGDQFGNINPTANITRAELAKIAVAASGQGDLAPILASAVRFADAQGHWGAGYIELGARMGLLKGRDEQTFDPDANITYAEVYTILLRMVGREPVGVWNPETIMQTAAQLGLAPAVGAEALAGLPAVRGVIFESLARAMTTLPLADGKTLAQKYFDSEPPVLTLSGSIPEATVAESVTISGTATGAHKVMVNGVQAVFQNGQFSAVVPLQPGPNAITVVAYDLAGNEASKTITVTQGGEVASIAISGPTQVNAGESVTLTVVAKDAQGRTMPNSLLTASVSGGLGTFDVNTGKFTAGTKAGVATITLSANGVSETYQVAVLGQAAEAVGLRIRPVSAGAFTAGKSGKIEVEVVDSEGRLVAHDGGRNVILSSRDSGLTVTNSVAQTVGGVATFTVTASEVGTYLVTATAIGLNSDSTEINFASSTRIVLVPTTEGPYKADGATPVRLKVELQNEAGNPVTNTTGEAIVVELDVNADDVDVTNRVSIADGGRSAEATVIPGVDSKTVTVRGIVTSGQPYSVIPVSLRFQEIQVGRAAKFEVGGAAATRYPGTPIELRVTAVDDQGNRVEGNFAFQVEVTTSNNDPKVDGVPEGVLITIGDTGFVPVADAADGVVARTRNGTATLTLQYNKSGTVTVKVIGVRGTSEAIADNGEVGSASSGVGLTGETVATYAGQVGGIELTAAVPSAGVTDMDAGVLRASASSSVRIRAVVRDQWGGHLPVDGGYITITRDGDDATAVTRVIGGNNKSASERVREGVAEFTIYGNGKAGSDTWTATYGTYTATITIHAVDSKPDQPVIDDIYGDKSHESNRIQPSDDYMVIELGNAPVAGYAKVYRSGSSSPIYTGAIRTGGLVYVPRSALRESDRYAVVVNNGYGDSAKSDLYPADPDGRVVVETPLKVNISKVRWNASGDDKLTLTVTASGVQKGGELDPTLIYLENQTTRMRRYLGGADCTLSTGSFTCDLSHFGFTANDFYGKVLLGTEVGWYRRDAAGQVADAEETLSDNYVTPTPQLEYVSVEKADKGGKVYLHGSGFSGSTIYPGRLSIGGTALGTSSATAKPTSNSVVSFTVSEEIMQAIAGASSLDGTGGWLVNSGSGSLPVYGVPIRARVEVKAVSYNPGTNVLTLHGSGLNGDLATSGPDTLASGVLVLKDQAGTEVLDLGGAEITSQSSSAIQLTLTAAQADVLEEQNDKGQWVHSRKVYLRSKGTWLTVDGRPAPALQSGLLLAW
ncbi:S-layer homology domain-containing protein [Symbiobacterium terraclitae]|uniref:S-layer homology domain-containing protein n=1 Tax=Symbiobacterium terraclitae TaxID=557451 RepID=UPI0035B54565